jgi:hypothetical protein
MSCASTSYVCFSRARPSISEVAPTSMPTGAMMFLIMDLGHRSDINYEELGAAWLPASPGHPS